MKIIERMKSPTPSFFRKVRNIGVILAAIAGAIVGSPVALPAVLVKIAGYTLVAGSIAGAVSQTATDGDAGMQKSEAKKAKAEALTAH